MCFQKISSHVWHSNKNGLLLSLVHVTCQFGDTDDFYRVEIHNVKGMNAEQAYEYFIENDNYDFDSFNKLKEVKKYFKNKYGIKIKKKELM